HGRRPASCIRPDTMRLEPQACELVLPIIQCNLAVPDRTVAIWNQQAMLLQLIHQPIVARWNAGLAFLDQVRAQLVERRFRYQPEGIAVEIAGGAATVKR